MGQSVPIPRGETVRIGASMDCDLVIDDPKASALHAGLMFDEDGTYRLSDLDSTNGILLKGARVLDAVIPLGATFVIGRTAIRLQAASRVLDIPASPARRFGDLVGESLAIRELFAVLELVAPTAVTVLIEGETGTGKELVARSLHNASDRRRGPFVALDCGAMSESLLESGLFGHIRGSFTGAARDRKGAFVEATGGTLFLDEIGSMSLSAQAKLLRVLETKRVRPVGADSERAVDVRIVAAANIDLEEAVAQGRFRPDLFYRLAVVRAQIPSLRARPDDILPISRALLHRAGFPADTLSGSGAEALLGYHWPGNVRELRNVLDRAVALSPNAERFGDLRIQVARPALVHRRVSETPAFRVDLPFKEARQRLMDEFEATYLRSIVAQVPDGNLSAMARLAGLDRKTLRDLLERHGLR